MEKNNSYFEAVFDTISEPIFLMEGQTFIDGNSSALSLFDINSKDELLLLHPSRLSPKYQPDGELSLVKANKMIELCYKMVNILLNG